MPYRLGATDSEADYDLVFAVTSGNDPERWKEMLLQKLAADYRLTLEDAGFFTLGEGIARFGAWLAPLEPCPDLGPIIGFVAVSLLGMTDLVEPLARCALGPILRLADGKVFEPVRERTILVARLCGRFGPLDDALLFAEEDSPYLLRVQARIAAAITAAGHDGFCGPDWDNKLRVGLLGKRGELLSQEEEVEALGSLEVSVWLFDRKIIDELASD